MYQMSRIGPGPAGYALPPTIGFDKHDVRRERKPMYSLRKRPGTHYDTLGPGPAKYDPGKMTRDGAPRTPKYSLGKRFGTFSLDKTPGPGAHNNDAVPSMKGNRPPAFSFGKRNTVSNTDKIPGPDVYMYDLNVYKNRNPSYSLRNRTTLPHAHEGPGPAGYGPTSRNITHKRSPVYSMRKTYGVMVDKTSRPGPNQYQLMNVKPGASAPQYSFGNKHSMWRPPMIIPGDNC
ncbi:outer dense fiber protein 3-like [Toxorhynchites rutilus septentrionalis]|uniref:outer dense fiber protein 3-like n=1 Tax=Toxorhynchites rutilus septentrionalis TaxID=329112 RepID=UPI00247A95CB|nr:outer dense fiber protein 3-like [Toxorhynchites rutilus septentrionalis]